MPKIGKRILKSSLAVFCCFMIYLLRNEQGIVFYSCIAAVLCVQQNTSNTIRVARNRVEGTLIGGFMGMFVLLFEKSFIPHDFLWIQYILISVMIIPIIYITVILKKTSASYISCVVFMSITVSHGADINPYMFALDRMIDTLIGIFVALMITHLHIHYHKDKSALFYIDIESLCHQGVMDTYSSIRLKQMMERGAQIGIWSDETPAMVLQNVSGLPMKYPLLGLRGAVLYDVEKQIYLQKHEWEESVYTSLYHFLQQRGCNVFVYTIIHDVMHIYYGELKNEDVNAYYQSMRKLPYEHYVYGEKPDAFPALCMMVLLRKELVSSLLHDLQDLPYYHEFNIFCRPCAHDEHMQRIYMTSHNDEAHPLKVIMKENHLSTLHVILSEEDPILHDLADSYAILNQRKALKQVEQEFYHKEKKA